MQIKKYETNFGGKKLSVEISDLADQANGSVLVRYGGTVVFATVVMSKRIKEGLDYFPLSVEYQEKFYAVGMILGGRFMKREGRPSDEAVLTGRLVDRTIRPLFDSRIRNEVQVTVTTLSLDAQNDPDVTAIIAASIAIGISDISWNGPVGAVRIAHINGDMNVNPTYEEKKESKSDIVISGKKGSINMMEAGCKEITEEMASNALDKAVEEIGKIITFQESIVKEIGKKKQEIKLEIIPQEMVDLFEKEIVSVLEDTIYNKHQDERFGLKDKWMELFTETFPAVSKNFADDLFEDEVKKVIQKNILENEKRPDGRKLDEIRPLFASTGLLPLSHGSGVFYRGGTHVLSIVTLGGPKDAQLIEGMEIQMEKRFMHHYNFPPFSTGETGRMGAPGRREIGHGALAERALEAVIPGKEIFPYTIRIVSESMASNGSTSMGSTCASTLALMDAGVPIKAPVVGIAMGIVVKDDKYKLLTDIQGIEDHYGGMDFKVTGTVNGITAIQLDCKLEGLSAQMLKDAFVRSAQARKQVMATLLQAIAEPRAELSSNAPRIVKVMIDPEKIGAVIGPAGKVIKGITEKTGAEIDIEQDGTVLITGKNHKDTDAAKKMIEDLTREFEVGEIVEGEVVKIMDFGAIIDLGGGKDGMAHVSELKDGYVKKVEDVVKMGDKVKVKVIRVEDGRIGLSLRGINK
ncbi:MAG: polyribonucleotide nucleotidyltransferase [Patescibacteria group bacterium]